MKILPSAAREEEEALKTAGPLLEELTSLLTLDWAWVLVGCVDPLLKIPNELPTDESLEPDLKVFGEAGSTEPPLTILCSLLRSFKPRLTTCGDEGSAEPLLKDLRTRDGSPDPRLNETGVVGSFEDPLLDTAGLAASLEPRLLCAEGVEGSAEPLRGMILASGSVEPLL